MSKRQTQQFKAKGEWGQLYSVLIYQDVIDTSDMRNGRSETLGRMKQAVTSEGHVLKYIDDDKFQRIDSGEILHVIP